MDDVANETKVLYCTEYSYVDAEATWTESGYTYPGRSANESSFKAEVSRSHSRIETSHLPTLRVKMEVSQIDRRAEC